VFHLEGSVEAERWVRERLLWLLCGDVGQVIASIRRDDRTDEGLPVNRTPVGLNMTTG
jgi:hypothetical protein